MAANDWRSWMKTHTTWNVVSLEARQMLSDSKTANNGHIGLNDNEEL